MRRLIILMLVCGLASLANATVIDVVAVDIAQSGGRLGRVQDPLEVSDVLGLQIVLNHNPYPGYSYPSYDGYFTDSVGLDLHASGAGSLGVVLILHKHEGEIPDLKHHAEFSVWTQSNPLIIDNGIAEMAGSVLEGGIRYDEDGGGGPGVLIWNLLLECDGFGTVVLDLTLQDTASRYSDYATLEFSTPPPYVQPFPGWQPLLESDLGDLTIYAVPEPMSIALLGLGSLFLLRRRK